MQKGQISHGDKANFILYFYNGYENRVMCIRNATLNQVMEFVDAGGNADYPEYCFDRHSTDYLLITLGSQEDWEQQKFNLVLHNELPSYAFEIPQWVVDYHDYPEGKIVPDPLYAITSTTILVDEEGKELELPDNHDNDNDSDPKEGA